MSPSSPTVETLWRTNREYNAHHYRVVMAVRTNKRVLRPIFLHRSSYYRLLIFLSTSYSRLFSVSTFLHSLRYFVVVRGIFFYSNVINTFDNSNILAKLNFVRRNFQTTEFCTRAIPISGRRNSSDPELGATQFPREQFPRVATPMQRSFPSMFHYFGAGRFWEWQFRSIPSAVISTRCDSTVVELLVFTIATRFDSTRDNSSAPLSYVQRF